MMKRHDVTITDIAKRMGLSVYTVSRALNGLSGVSESTRASVRETANEVGYIPNVNARDLRTGTHRFITLLTAGMSNSYYLDLIDGIESVLQDKKESLFIADMAVNGRYSKENEAYLLRQVVENRPGGIISTLGLSEYSRNQLKNWNIPVVFVDSTPGYGDDEEIKRWFLVCGHRQRGCRRQAWASSETPSFSSLAACHLSGHLEQQVRSRERPEDRRRGVWGGDSRAGMR